MDRALPRPAAGLACSQWTVSLPSHSLGPRGWFRCPVTGTELGGVESLIGTCHRKNRTPGNPKAPQSVTIPNSLKSWKKSLSLG